MADTAAHLRDCILPSLPVRQWIFTIPKRLRFLVAFRPKLICLMLRLFLRALFAPAAQPRKARGAANYPRIVLGYGEQNLFAATHAELRAHLPPADTLTTPGAHAWGTWRVLLERIAQRDLLNPPGQTAC